MLENRSLDNVLGWLYPDAQHQPESIIGLDASPYYEGLQRGPHSNRYGDRTLPVTRGTHGKTGFSWIAAQPLRVPGMDPNERYEHVNQQLFGSPGHSAPNNPPYGTPAKMAGFAEDYGAWWETWEQLEQIMEAYSPEQLPILNGLARAYAVSDAWYSSVPTQTNPNRAFSLCGTSLGRVNNNSLLAVEQFETKTLWNALPKDTSWGIYHQDIWHEGQCYTQYTFPRCSEALDTGEVAPIATFYSKARAGELPNFSYLEPKWGYGLGTLDGFACGKFMGTVFGTQGNDYHPPTWLGPGEYFLNEVYTALTANRKAWARTLLIVTFDEHGGTYDHVDPRWGAITPDEHRGPDGFAFDRYGVRVPTLLISPRVASGTVFRSAKPQLQYDHTSVIATLLRWRGVDPASAGLGARVARAPTFEGVLTDRCRDDVPTFTVPEGYAEQGKQCCIDTQPSSVPIGVMRSLVEDCRTLPELEARVRDWLSKNGP
jgi:phospholipase C